MLINEVGKMTNKRKKIDYHIKYLKILDREWQFLKSIPNFPYFNNNHFYSRKDESGWWMTIKQTAIRGYVNAYLKILGKKDLPLIFLDLMSSYGLNCVTKNHGKDRFYFPGTSINAALISNLKPRGFDSYYINDYNIPQRRILAKRMEALKNYFKKDLNFHITLEDRKIDSNQWVIKSLEEVNTEYNNYYNYLMVIDNEGMNIDYATIKNVIKIHEYGDIIINFQNTGISRAIPVSKLKRVEKFFGRTIPTGITQDELCDIYCDQLNKIGLGNIEKMKVSTATGFYYTLLFCCREEVSGDWLKLIKYYNNQFKNVTDKEVKQVWDIKQGRQLRIDQDWDNK